MTDMKTDNFKMAEFKMDGGGKATDFDMDKTNLNSDEGRSSTEVSLMPDKQKVRADKPDIKQGRIQKTWYEFSQSTTMHGVNKITEQTPFTMRRVLWVLIVLTGLALCVRQMVESVMYYRQYPVTVNVKINYNSSIDLPAITVCNQNDFRATASERLGKYELVRDYFSNLASGGSNLTLEEQQYSLAVLYQQTAHRMEDMIVECTWDENECGEDDFALTITDYGYCYSYNSGQNGKPPIRVSTTGADRGLHLLLNIEQYDYMKGPNPGAGIKLLIHAQDEVPLVRDLGQAVPPGSFAFVGLQMIEVNNLKPPHGVCNDSLELDYYPTYSMSACMIECKQKYVTEKCHCRDVYMPASNGSGINSEPTFCNLSQYQSCFLEHMKTFNDKDDGPPCDCPVPCKRTMYDAQISYASVSNYDTDKLLRSNFSVPLKHDYVAARETHHRVNEQFLEHDRELIKDMDEKSEGIDRTMIGIREMIAELGRRVHEDHYHLEERLKFHNAWGVEKVVYIMHHDFARGFDVMVERTFSVVTPFYLEIVAYCEEVFDVFLHNGTVMTGTTGVGGNVSDARKLIMLETADAMLRQRRVSATRAIDNMTEVYTAYNTSTPLLTYKSSPLRRYDMTWITPEVVTDGSDNVVNYGEIILISLERFRVAAFNMQMQLQQAYEFQNVTRDAFDKEVSAFRAAVRRYNYYLFLFKERVAYKCDETALELQKVYEERVAKYLEAHEELFYYVDVLGDFLHELDAPWKHLTSLRELANDYAANPYLRKTLMAEAFTGDVTTTYSNDLQTFFAELLSRSRRINTLIVTLQIATEELWTNLLTDTSVDLFYQKLLEDIALFRNGTEYDVLRYAFSYMLDINETMVEKNVDFLETMLNADFVTTTLDDKLAEVKEFFDGLNTLNNVDEIITNEKVFFEAFTVLQNELITFIDDSNINNEFYRQNFMQVDVFMRDLSYEQIDQQVAYGLTSLWSDIGGTMGLLIGASVMTVFEFIDVIIHSLFRFYCQPERPPPTMSKTSNGY